MFNYALCPYESEKEYLFLRKFRIKFTSLSKYKYSYYIIFIYLSQNLTTLNCITYRKSAFSFSKIFYVTVNKMLNLAKNNKKINKLAYMNNIPCTV